MLNILIIDDDEDMLKIINLVLKASGYNVETATNGKEGIRKFDAGAFDLVITDMRMPDLDGNDVAQYIRESVRDFIPIIGISGTLWLLENDNFDMIIQKPFTTKRLIDSIKELTSQND